MRTLRCGRISVDKVVDLDTVPFPAQAIYPDATPEIMRAEQRRLGAHHVDPASLDLLLSFHCFVVRTGGLTILVDTCVGNDKERPTRPPWHRRRGPFLDRLRAAGVAPEDVDIVMCTHLHADHVGWNTQLVDGAWVPTFPRARYLFAEAEFKYWQRLYDGNPATPIAYGSFADSILPVVASGQADMISTDHRVATGIQLEGAAGHTPGTLLIHVEDGSGHAILCGDILHHPVQMAHPEWSTHFCVNPELSRRNRTGLLCRYADTETRLLTGHFQSPTAGRIRREGAAYRFEFDKMEDA